MSSVPEYIIKNVLKAAEMILTTSINILGDIIKAPKNQAYAAEWGKYRVIARPGNKGFSVDGKNNLPIDDESYRNMMCIAGTGLGKTSVNIISSILRMMGVSFVIHDPSKELFEKTSGALLGHDKPYQILVIDWLNSSRSDGYNILKRCYSQADASWIAHTLVDAATGKSSGDPFWNNSAENLITTLICILLEQDAKYRTIANVIHLLTALAANPHDVDVLFSKARSDKLVQEYKAIIGQSEKTLAGIISSAQSALKVFQNEEVQAVTSFDTIDFSRFRERPVALYIQNSTMSQKYLGALTTILFTQFFTEQMKEIPGEEALSIFNIIDETASFTLDWPIILSNARKYKIGNFLALQSFDQLVEQYGPNGAQTIRSNCYGQLFYTNQSLKTCRDLEAILGKFQYVEPGTNIVRVRPLMTSDEIRTMPHDEAIFLAGNHLPFKVKLRPWYKTDLKKLVQLPPAPLPQKKPFAEIPLLPLQSSNRT